jgi:hypothetical protein
MGSRVINSAGNKPWHGRDHGGGFSNEPRITVHFDGTDNNKQNDNLAARTVWVNLNPVMRPGIQLSVTMQSMNSGGAIALGGSLAPGRLADILDNSDYGDVLVADTQFEVISASLASGVSVSTEKPYSLLRIVFPASPCTLVITAI